MLRGSAEFYLSIPVPDTNGKLITSPSVSPENRFMTDSGVSGSVVGGTDRNLKPSGFDPGRQLRVLVAQGEMRLTPA